MQKIYLQYKRDVLKYQCYVFVLGFGSIYPQPITQTTDKNI